MDYTAEVTQLLVIVIVLGAAYIGVQVWTRSQKNRDGGGGGLLGRFGGGGDSAGAAGGGAPLGGGLDDEDSDLGGVGGGKGSDRNKGRFQLQGRDAEVAAKVLKRMLKQDPGFKQGEE
ncbi:TPA: hypothetical protein DCE37_10820 [Candidatus Latescibacteria bacterium]|nr:hypothetical protein [Candidatus Latescibacterota bacterium]